MTTPAPPAPRAFVTGASRGIGRAVAISLAAAGYDVAISARTLEPGERREHSSTRARSNTSALPGSLLDTAVAIEAHGRRALPLPADLVELPSVTAALRTAIATWGGIEVLVNNGRYVGPGHMDHFLDTPLDLLRLMFEANVFVPLELSRIALEYMRSAGHGVIVNISSEVAYLDPPQAAGAGGWGLGYAMTKAAAERIAGVLAREITDAGIAVYNVEPGFVLTERTALELADFGIDIAKGAKPELIGEVVAWLVTQPALAGPSGSTIKASQWRATHGESLDTTPFNVKN